jgi:hypothetical protein
MQAQPHPSTCPAQLDAAPSEEHVTTTPCTYSAHHHSRNPPTSSGGTLVVCMRSLLHAACRPPPPPLQPLSSCSSSLPSTHARIPLHPGHGRPFRLHHVGHSSCGASPPPPQRTSPMHHGNCSWRIPNGKLTAAPGLRTTLTVLAGSAARPRSSALSLLHLPRSWWALSLLGLRIARFLTVLLGIQFNDCLVR